MKKIIALFLVTILLLSAVPVYANDILGETVYTDIITYINHYPIPSYNFNGNTLIAAEDSVITHFAYMPFGSSRSNKLEADKTIGLFIKKMRSPGLSFNPKASL